MDEKKDVTVTVSEEEQKFESEALVEAKEEEVRAKIITEFGFDEVDDAEKIDKLVKKELDHSKKLSTAIGQKINWRTKATTPPPLVTPPQTPAPKGMAPEDVEKVVSTKLSETLEQRDLEAMEYPENIKKEIQRIAKITNVSVKQAERDPYVITQFIEPWRKENKLDEATISKTNKHSGKRSDSFDKIPDFDMSTEKGRKDWEEWKDGMKKKGY